MLNDKIETVTKCLQKKIKSLQKRNTEQEKFIQEMLKNQTISENKTNAKLDEFLTELHEVNEFIKYQTESLSQKVEKCEDNNETILNNQEQIENKYNTLHDVSKDLEKLKKDFTDVSQMESSNKLNLEKFQNKFTDIDSKVATFSGDLDTIFQDIMTLKYPKLAESFCVDWDDSIESDVKSEEIVTRFNRFYNLDDSQQLHFDTQTGVYTAPCDGLYLICLMIENLSDYQVQFNVFSKYDEEFLSGICHVAQKNITTSTVIPITLKTGTTLYLKYEEDYNNLSLGPNSTFACVLIQKR
uniref:Uncharacterized protein n=1 Tax=Biomphalaria glabrata TaxID=6526 RepID=A0A2C9LVN2_BIOGL